MGLASSATVGAGRKVRRRRSRSRATAPTLARGSATPAAARSRITRTSITRTNTRFVELQSLRLLKWPVATDYFIRKPLPTYRYRIATRHERTQSKIFFNTATSVMTRITRLFFGLADQLCLIVYC